jgi:hypothetical protein
VWLPAGSGGHPVSLRDRRPPRPPRPPASRGEQLRELNSILLAAVAFGWLAEAPMAAERDRLGGILYGLQRR